MSLEVIIGPMFSGKSTYALSYIRRQRAIGKNVLVMKPNIDNRYSAESILVTHDHETIPCMIWNTSETLNPAILEVQTSDCIVLEESQFFVGLKNFVMFALKVFHKNVLVVGLDGDANQCSFGEVLNCIPWATQVTKLCALCSQCSNGTLGPFTRKIDDTNSQQVDVGGSDKYVSVCLKHLTDNQ